MRALAGILVCCCLAAVARGQAPDCGDVAAPCPPAPVKRFAWPSWPKKKPRPIERHVVCVEEQPVAAAAAGVYATPPRYGDSYGAAESWALSGAAITFPQFTFRCPTIRLPQVHRTRTEARVLVAEADAPFVPSQVQPAFAPQGGGYVAPAAAYGAPYGAAYPAAGVPQAAACHPAPAYPSAAGRPPHAAARPTTPAAPPARSDAAEDERVKELEAREQALLQKVELLHRQVEHLVQQQTVADPPPAPPRRPTRPAVRALPPTLPR